MSDTVATDSLAIAGTRNEGKENPSGFTLVVISPSNGVNGPLHFPNTAATATVKDIKAKIRDRVSSKPADDGQRLIHHGRLLGREEETMLDVFGQELGNGETKTLHLVLRDPPSSVDYTTGSQRPAHELPPVPPVPPHSQVQPLPQTVPALAPANPLQGTPGQQPLPSFQHITPQHHALHQADNTQQLISQRLAQLQQETRRLHQEMLHIEQRSRAIAVAAQQSQQNLINHQQSNAPHFMPNTVRDIIAQRQRDRAVEGRQGVQNNGQIPYPLGSQPVTGRASPSLHRPDGTTTYTREGVGPNGERWSMTVNETNVTLPLGQPHSHHQAGWSQNPALDQLQNILRNADRYVPNQASQNPPNSIERARSNPLPVPRIPTPAISDTQTGTATPATTNSSPTSVAAPNVPNVSTEAPVVTQASNTPIIEHIDPVVYLLSSPNGPRALLINNSDTFYTPRVSSRRRRNDESAVASPGEPQNNVPDAAVLPEFRNRHRGVRRPHRHRENNANPPEGARPAPAQAQLEAGALAARIGPMIWLIVRLVGFVWFFTAGNPSWSRWLMVSALAVVVFIINTGIFNGIFEQLWGPIRRHVDALIPLAGREAAQIPAFNAAIPPAPPADVPMEPGQEPAQGQRQRRGELDPAEVAAHLLEQHRQRNAGWLRTQIRRAEHAMLLFLASLVPGVGERHIAAREAEAVAAEAERQRRIEAVAAADNPNPEAGEGEQANSLPATEPSAELGSSSDASLRNNEEEAGGEQLIGLTNE